MTNHPGDRHVTAAAWHAQADAIVTLNLRHFPAAALVPLNVRAVHPDVFLLECFRSSPDAFIEIVYEQARDRTISQQTVVDVVNGVALLSPKFAAAVREWMEEHPI